MSERLQNPKKHDQKTLTSYNCETTTITFIWGKIKEERCEGRNDRLYLLPSLEPPEYFLAPVQVKRGKKKKARKSSEAEGWRNLQKKGQKDLGIKAD